MKRLVTSFMWTLLLCIGFGFSLFGAPTISVSYSLKGEKNINSNPNKNSRLSVNSIERNFDFFASEVIEIESNNYVQLVAEPYVGYIFAYWSLNGEKTSEAAVYQFLMPNRDVVVSANYIQIPPPAVQITSPNEGSVYNTSEIINLNINASSSEGEINKVELFINEDLVSTFFEAPFEYDLENYPEGDYNLMAIATDNTGQKTTSEKISIRIENENISPTVSITSPSENSQFIQGESISITSVAEDADGSISSVEFYAGNTLLGTDATSPYRFEWTNIPAGSFAITARATDDKGAVMISVPVSINIVDQPNLAPTVSITSPAKNSIFTQGENISIASVAEDADGSISKVDFYAGNTLLGTDAASPYKFEWTNIPAGSFSLTAKATDDKGTVAISNPVQINIIEEENLAPTASITSPSDNAQLTQGENISITSVANDADGSISSVDFYAGNNLLGTDTTSPYSFDWTNIPAGSFSLTVKATDDKGTTLTSEPITISVIESENPFMVENFTLINADTEQDMFNLENGMQIEANITSDLNLNIRGNTNPNTVGSVYFTLTGPVNLTRVENAMPYTVFGDSNGDYFGSTLPEGTYTLTARAYSESNRRGTESQVLSLTFSITDTENLAPTVSITSPSKNSQFIQGENISITSVAEDTDGSISSVDFYAGNTLLGTDATLPYRFEWTNIPTGSFSLTARATDDEGTVTISVPVSINIVDKPNLSPTVSITSPSENSQFIQGENISITSVAEDSDGSISLVEFYAGNTLLGTDTTSPYRFDWTNIPVGRFTLTTKATDDKGTVTVSAPVSINVVDKPNLAPTVTITSPAENTQFTQGDNISITSVAQDTDGSISSVDFYAGNTFLGSDATSPFRFDWANIPAGSFALTAKATDDKGTVTVSVPVSINVVDKPNLAPTVTITSPAANTQFIQGENISITSVAQDTDGSISSVDFYAGNTFLGSDATSPFRFDWANIPVGSFSLTAKATDDKGTTSTSDPITISVIESENLFMVENFTLINADTEQDMFNLENGMQIEANITSDLNLNIRGNTNPTTVGSVYFTLTGPVNLTRLENAMPYTAFGDSNGDYFGLSLPEGTYTLTARAYTESNRGGTEGPIRSLTFTIAKTENIAPTVSITSPAENNQFTEGDNISITSVADDTDGTITKVELYNDNILLGTDNTTPYSFSLYNLPIGDLTFTAKATDNKGASTVSTPIKINVIERENVAPIVSIISPAEYTQFKKADNISITSTALDPDGAINKVEFYAGNTLLGTDTKSPYSFDWTNIPVGSFALTAKATDDKGKTSISDPLVIDVIENENAAPTVSIISPAENAQFTLGENISITSTATDSDGTITKVDFYAGNTLLGTDTTTPYSFDWRNIPVGNFFLTAKATDDKGTETVSNPVSINVVEKENVAPTVSITSPAENTQFIQGDNISITSIATDSDGTIAKVEFYAGTTLLGTDTTSPYSFDWTNIPTGSYNLTAKATDDKGTAKVSDPLSINVVEKENVAPTVSITSPAENTQFIQGDNISITSIATDSDGTIAKVEFYAGNTLLGTDTTSPYSFDWTNIPTGTYNLTAKATDDKGTAKVSDPLSINVVEKENVVPTVSITSPAENTQFIQGDNITITSVAEDVDGIISSVEFYAGNTLLGTDTASPYNFEWIDIPVGNFALKAKATDDKGTSTMSSAISINIKERESSETPEEVIIPEIIIITPVNNQEFEADEDVEITVMFQGSDESVNEVEYYSGDQLIGSSSTSPFGFTWQGATSGNHYITAKAVGKETENFKLSVPVTILIKEETQKVFQIIDPIQDAIFVQGENITIRVEIPEKNNSIKRIDYFRRNIRLGSSTEAPYNFTWKNVPKGDHDLSARLIYTNGANESSSVVPIKVLKKNQANVRLLSPSDGPEIVAGDDIDLKVELSEFENPIESVDYLLDGEVLGSSKTYPYNLLWKNIPEGEHELMARVVESSNSTVYSESMVLSVREDTINPVLEYVIGPNPSTEFLNVIFTNLEGNYEFEFRVIAMNGVVQKVFNAKSENSKVTIDVSDLQDGVYVLQLITNGNSLSSRKFIKK